MDKKRRIIRAVLTLFLLLSTTTLFAATTIYKTQEKNGATLYSDIPQKNSKKIQIDNNINVNQATTISNNPIQENNGTGNKTTISTNGSKSSAPTAINAITSTDYNLKITSPENQTTFQNQLPIPVSVLVSPTLKEGDQLQLIVDGKPYGKPENATTINVDNLDRGTHQIQAGIFDSKTKTITKVSRPITIYKHQTSTLLPTRQQVKNST